MNFNDKAVKPVFSKLLKVCNTTQFLVTEKTYNDIVDLLQLDNYNDIIAVRNSAIRMITDKAQSCIDTHCDLMFFLYSHMLSIISTVFDMYLQKNKK